MAWTNQPKSMQYDDEDIYDRQSDSRPDVPDYPVNLQFTIDEADLEKVGHAGGDIHQVMPFSAMGEVTSVHRSADGSRVELRLTQFAGADGKFIDLSMPGHICFCDYELDKLGIEADCDLGDLIHLIGEARLESTHKSDFAQIATLQVVKLTFEDESDESRDGE